MTDAAPHVLDRRSHRSTSDSRPTPPGTGRATALVIAITVIVFWLISTSFRPWDLFDRAGFSADFYDEQARAFLRGELAVDPAVPGPEGFLIDGRTYLYYGPFLAIVRIPFALFGDVFVGRLVRVSMLVSFVVLCFWSARLARVGLAVVRPGLDERMLRWGSAMFVAAVATSPALFASGWITVYHETELWALTLAVIAITSVLEWAASAYSDRRALALAAVATLAATLTRAPIGLGVALGLGVCGLVLMVRRRRADPVGIAAVTAGVLPLLVHAIVNFAKFGSWLSVPGDRQLLSLQNETRAAFFAETGGSFFSIRFLPTTLVQYLRPDTIRLERLVPGIRFGPLAEDRGSIAVETVTPASSLPAAALLLLVLAVLGAVGIVRRRRRMWALLVVTTTVGAVPAFLIGFVANRYLIDMLPPLITAGAVGIWLVAAWAADRRLARIGLAGLAVFGLWVNASLAIWTLELKSPGFTELRYDIDRAVFGGPPPSVVETRAGAPVPRDGIVGVLDDCSGVYIAEQGRWVALERSPQHRFVDGSFPPQVPTVLAATPTWTLRAEPTDDDAVDIVFERFDGGEGFTRTVPVDGDSATFQVVSDPVSDEFAAAVEDSAFFLPRDVLLAGGTDIDPSGDGDVVPTPLCLELSP